jgi:hypothetical protein
MPPKGTKSPRTKSPKTAKGGAVTTWETTVTTTSVNEVRRTKILIELSFWVLLNRIIGQHLFVF